MDCARRSALRKRGPRRTRPRRKRRSPGQRRERCPKQGRPLRSPLVTVPPSALTLRASDRDYTAYYAPSHACDEGGADFFWSETAGSLAGARLHAAGHSDEVIYHCRAVARGTQRALVVGDLPFLSFQLSSEQALKNAGRFLSEGGAHAVKLEGGLEAAEAIRRIVSVGIPVVGHVGLMPQSVHAMGGFRVQGKTEQAARAVPTTRAAVAEAGAFAIVTRRHPVRTSQRASPRSSIFPIGIGAGSACDGRCWFATPARAHATLRPKFVKRYARAVRRWTQRSAAILRRGQERRVSEEAHALASAAR